MLKRRCRFLMRMSLFVGMTLFALTVGAAALKQRRDPVAALMHVKGKVWVKRAGEKGWKRAVVNMALYEGDVLKTGPDGQVTVWFQSCRSRTIGANKVVPIQTLYARRDTWWQAIWAAFLRRMRRNYAEESLAAVAAARSPSLPPPPSFPRLLTPRNTRLLSDRPIFWWEEVPKAKGYRVALGLFGTKERVWETVVSHPPLLYPENAPKLRAGHVYVWRVEAIGVTEAVDSAWFTLVPRPEARDIQFVLHRLRQEAKDPITYALSSASFLEARRLYADAIKILRETLRAYPDRADLRLTLTHLYEAIGLKDKAEEERARLRKSLPLFYKTDWQSAASQ